MTKPASTFPHAHPAWTAPCPIQPPDDADAGRDDSAGGAGEDSEWIGLGLSQENKTMAQTRPGDIDIQVGSGSKSSHTHYSTYEINTSRVGKFGVCVGNLCSFTIRSMRRWSAFAGGWVVSSP